MENLDMLHLIYSFCETHKGFISLLSVTKGLNQLKDRFIYNKEDVDDSEIPLDLWYLSCLKRLVRYVSCVEDLYDPPSPIRHIVLRDGFAKCLMKFPLPKTMESITFPYSFNGFLKSNWIPNTTKKVTFGTTFNKPLGGNDLPNGLEVLIFGDDFNGFLSVYNIPRTLREIKLGKRFNQAIIPGTFPSTLKRLDLGEDFKYIPIGTLPYGLEYLKLSSKFNRPFSRGLIPDTLTTLDIGASYSHPIGPGCLPSSLKELTIRGYEPELMQSIQLPGVLPESLERLIITNRYVLPLYIPYPSTFDVVCKIEGWDDALTRNVVIRNKTALYKID